jgi:hypothetical protein
MNPSFFAEYILGKVVAEPLVGDLREQLATGRSRAWYRRQVITAIVVATLKEIRDHKLLALRGLAIGYALTWVYFRFGQRRVFSILYQAADFHEFLFMTGLTSWFYLHHVRLPQVVLQFGVGPITDGLGWLVVGWVVGRFHGARIAVAFSVIYVVGLLLTIAPFLARGIMIPGATAIICVAYVSVLVGGVCGGTHCEGERG